MALPNVNITLGNGALGRTSATSDGVAGLVLTGNPVSGKLELDQVYQLSSSRDLTQLGVTEENNPLVYKEISAFYAQAGDGAELYLVVVKEETSLCEMVAAQNEQAPIHKLMAHSGGRIRLVGLNKIEPEAEEVTDPENEQEVPRTGHTQGIDKDAIDAAAAAHSVAEDYAQKMSPFRVLLPAYGWNGETANLYKPRQSSYNRAGFILAADRKIGEVYSAAVGQVLGRAAGIEPQQSVARVKSGAIATEGYLTNGKTYLEVSGQAEALNDAGYIFYRSFPTKNGCYLNDDCMAAPESDDYSTLSNGRITDKAKVVIYSAYIDEVLDNLAVDENGKIPQGACKNFEGIIENAIASQMGSQISNFKAYVDADQNILSTGQLRVTAQIVPQGILRMIQVDLSFDNPQLSNN